MATVPLDNAIWRALHGRQRAFGAATESAARFDPEVSVFSALPDEISPSDWDDLAALHQPGAITALLRARVTAPAGWEELASFQAVQLVADDGIGSPEPDPEAVLLGPDDVPEMLELVRATEPGPFARRTVELGTYLGIRRAGALVAMAGQRVRLDGYVEVSAVCTAAGHRRQGLAVRLVADLVGRIQAGGDAAYLHASTDNVAALAVYEGMGFRRRAVLEGTVVRIADRPS